MKQLGQILILVTAPMPEKVISKFATLSLFKMIVSILLFPIPILLMVSSKPFEYLTTTDTLDSSAFIMPMSTNKTGLSNSNFSFPPLGLGFGLGLFDPWTIKESVENIGCKASRYTQKVFMYLTYFEPEDIS
jgi:hypothetical protein